jgi:hypothetical protein
VEIAHDHVAMFVAEWPPVVADGIPVMRALLAVPCG